MLDFIKYSVVHKKGARKPHTFNFNKELFNDYSAFAILTNLTNSDL